MIRLCESCAIMLLAAAVGYAEEAAPESGSKIEPNAGERLVAASGESPPESLYGLSYELDRRLFENGDDALDLAEELLAVARDVVDDQPFDDHLQAVAKDRPVLAARLLLQTAGAANRVKTVGRGAVVVGRIAVADGELEPADIQAQSLILDDGHFATDVGDLNRPIAFRASGYEDLDVSLPTGEHSGIVLLDLATMRPLAPERRAALRGRVQLDGPKDFGAATIHVGVAMGDINTPSGGYPGRAPWQPFVEPRAVVVGADGAFEVEGLNPTEYSLMIAADEHVPFYRKVALTSGETLDAGTCRLYSTDLGLYVGHEPPETPELTWEADYAAALERAQREDRPLLVMMTATWCGPCKMLEEQTLNDPWIRHFLSPFVMVQAYEDKTIEEKYEGAGYPTLAFCNSEGKLAYKCTGFEPAYKFAGQCAQALSALSLELPEELRLLIDKKIVASELGQSKSSNDGS
jgi:thiol-disulfide isomerase/thioredoxin